jgi:hypothetical protein
MKMNAPAFTFRKSTTPPSPPSLQILSINWTTAKFPSCFHFQQVHWIIWWRLCPTSLPKTFKKAKGRLFVPAWETVLGETPWNPPNALSWISSRVPGMGFCSSTDQRTPGVFYLLRCCSVRTSSWNWLDLGFRVFIWNEYAWRESDSTRSSLNSRSRNGKALAHSLLIWCNYWTSSILHGKCPIPLSISVLVPSVKDSYWIF